MLKYIFFFYFFWRDRFLLGFFLGWGGLNVILVVGIGAFRKVEGDI